MSNVIQLDDRRPHYVGHVTCAACNHEWTAVVPVKCSDTDHLQCPECGASSGVLERGQR